MPNTFTEYCESMKPCIRHMPYTVYCTVHGYNLSSSTTSTSSIRFIRLKVKALQSLMGRPISIFLPVTLYAYIIVIDNGSRWPRNALKGNTVPVEQRQVK